MTLTRRASAAAAANGAQVAAPVQTPAIARGGRAAASKARAAEPEVAVAAEEHGDVMAVDATVTIAATVSKRGHSSASAAKQQPAVAFEEPQQQEQPAKRPRGRPRKSVPAEQGVVGAPALTPGNASTEQEEIDEPAAKRAKKGGRTPKPAVAAAAAAVLAGAEEVLRLTSPRRSPLAPVKDSAPAATSSDSANGTTDAPSTAANGAPGAGPADASHQLQPHDSSTASVAAGIGATAAAATMPATVSPVLVGSPSRATARPLLASQLLRSPPASPRRPLVATAAAAAAAAAAKAASPKPAPAVAATSAADPASTAAVAAPAADTVAAPTAGTTLEQTVAQVRRLLQTGALAGTLLSSAAAAGAAPDSNSASAATAPAAGTAGNGASTSGAEPAGRAVQFKELCGLVNQCCTSGRGTAVYISGLPGTGKTYTVTRLLAALPALGGAAATFCAATVNCMTLDDPVALCNRLNDELSRAAAGGGDAASAPASSAPAPSGGGAAADAAAAYEALVSSLTRLSVVRSGAVGAAGKAAAAKGKGAKAGTKRGRGGSKAADEPAEVTAAGAAGPRRRVFVVVLDEVDRLLRRRDGGEDLARLFQLPSAPGVSLVLLAVANSLDLTERMMPLLRSRGLAPRHMVFTAYSRPQVLAILQAQLGAHPGGRRLFEDGALDMVAKSVSSSSGDLRQALKACRTALDVLLDHNRANPANPRPSVGIRELHTALQRISAGSGASAAVAKIKGLPPQQQLVLLALATAVGARAAAESGGAAAVVIPGPGGAGGACGAGGGGFQPGGAVFTGSRAKFMDAVAFREIGNQQPGPAAGAANPGACFGEAPQPAGPTPTKGGKGVGAGGGATPSTAGGRVRGVTGPGGATPPSRTPASRSILAGDAGLALALPDVYAAYSAMCRQLDIPAMSESALRTDALPGLDCDGLLKVQEGRTPAATRLTLRTMVKDVQAALADNVMFKRLLGSKAPAPGAGAVAAAGAPGAGVPGQAVRA